MAAQPKPETVQRWIGRRYGRLVVVAFDHYAPNRVPCWRCRCDCGNETVTANSNLLAGSTVSCGCYKKQFLVSAGAGNFKHGLSTTGAYYTWHNLLYRHEDELCDRWLDFEEFYADMGERPAGTTLVRLEASKGYEPGNCAWVSRREAAHYSARVVWLDYQGRRQIMSKWADELGMSRQLLSLRLKNGWSVERALSTPVKRLFAPE